MTIVDSRPNTFAGAGIIRAQSGLGVTVERHRVIGQSLGQKLEGQGLLDLIARFTAARADWVVK